MCFTVSYESRLAYTIKAHPDASKQEPRLMLLAALIIIILLYSSAVKRNVQPKP